MTGVNHTSAGSVEARRVERISMAREICMHRGENPDNIDRGGVADWEKYEPLAGAVIREAERLFKLRAPAQAALNRTQLAKTIYATWFDADFITENHFRWFDGGKDNPDSCVHYSNVAKAYKVADAILALAAQPPAAPVMTITEMASYHNGQEPAAPVETKTHPFEGIEELAEFLCDEFEGQGGSYCEFGDVTKGRWRDLAHALIKRRAVYRSSADNGGEK